MQTFHSMDDKISVILKYVASIFTTFGVSVFLLLLIESMLKWLMPPGTIEDVAGISTLFIENGLSVSTLSQFFAFSVLSVGLRMSLQSERAMARLPFLVRYFAMFAGIIGMAAVFILLFGWFPMNAGAGWLGFFIGFIICTAIGIVSSLLMTRAEKKKYARLLQEYKERRIGEETHGNKGDSSQ